MPKLNVNRKSALLLVVVGVIAAVLLWPKPARTWHGKTVQEWAREAARIQERADKGLELKDAIVICKQLEEVEDAILTFGPEAIPSLLAMMQNRPSAITGKLCQWGHRFGWDGYLNERYERESRAGAFGLGVFGPELRGVLPQLTTEFSEPVNSERVMPLLAGLGKPAMPVFLDALTNSAVRDSAFQGLSWLGTNASSASGTLRGFLTNSNPVLREKALRAFFYTAKPDAKLLAEITPFLSDRELGVRYTACEGLGWVAKELPPGTPELVMAAAAVAAMQHDPVETVRMFAAQALGRFGAAAEPQLPTLLELLNDNHGAVRFQAAQSLAALKLQLPTVVPALVERLDDHDASVREAVAESLRKLSVEAEKIQPSIVASLGDLGKSRYEHERAWATYYERREAKRLERLKSKQEAKK
ncbi:MAG: HEAT repeat domain-containing protein [Limisphaerales bacterium]